MKLWASFPQTAATILLILGSNLQSSEEAKGGEGSSSLGFVRFWRKCCWEAQNFLEEANGGDQLLHGSIG